MGKETLEALLDFFTNESLEQMIFSNPADKDGLLRVRVRPVLLRGKLLFQAEAWKGNQAFHRNLSAEGLKE